MNVNAYGAMLVLSCLVASVGAEEPSTPATTQATGGGWLKLSRTIHIDPEHQVALVFYGEKLKIESVYKVDLAERKAVKLCDLPAETVDRSQNFDIAPRYAALTADGKTILLDKETKEDEANLPNGRTCLWSDAPSGKQMVVAMQRTIYALPSSGGPAKAIARNGDFNEWRYDVVADRVLAVACERGQKGLVVLKTDGTREELEGFRRNESTGMAIMNGRKMPSGGCMEANPIRLGSKLFTCMMWEVCVYTQGSGAVEILKPVKTASIVGMSLMPDGKGLVLLARTGQDTCQLMTWTPGAAPAQPLGGSFALNSPDHNHVSSSSDGSAIWVVSESNVNPRGPREYKVRRVDPKTGQWKEYTTSMQIEDLVEKARKEEKK